MSFLKFSKITLSASKPFEEAGYNVKVKFREAKPNEAAARVVMRELEGGQLINSKVAFDFGAGVVDVYEELKDMVTNYVEMLM